MFHFCGFSSGCNRPAAAVAGLLLAGSLIQGRSARAYAKDSVPDWVHAAASAPSGSYPPRTDAVVLLDDTTLSVAPDGRAVQRIRHVVKILRPGGRDEGVVRVFFDKDSKINFMHVWSIGPDGHEYALKDNELLEVGLPGEGNFYVDERFKAANPPGRDPGGIVAYEYEQRLAAYDHEATWFFEDNLPHLKQSFTLELPANFKYVTVWAHHPDQKAVDLEHQRYRWEANGTPGIDLERVPMAPNRSALEGRMTVHFAPAADADLGTWKGVGNFYDQLARDRMTPTPEIATKAAQLTAGKVDFYAKTEAIAEFVQKQIRYYVVEQGIGGRQPHPAADILRVGYGDCKDKSTLLSAMLKSVGIRSTLVLVDSHRGFVDPAAPSVLGNHAIAAVEIPEGYDSPKLRSVVKVKSGRRYLIVDPTSEETAFGQLEHNLQGGYAVIVEGRQSEIVQIPVLRPELNTLSRSASFELAADGTLKGAITEKRFGDLSERERSIYLQGEQKERQSLLDRSLARDFVSFNVAGVKTENAEALNQDLTTTFELSADRFARNVGPLMMVRPRVLGEETLYADRKPRTVPINLDQAMQEKDDFTIRLPEGYTTDEVPEPVSLDLGFAAYQSSTKVDGNMLHYTRTYTVRDVTLPAERYADVQHLAEVIHNDEQNRAVLKKK